MPPHLTSARFRELLDRTRAKAVSFDVFDTVVTRTYAQPADLFTALGDDLRQRGLWPSSALGLRSARVAAECAARAAHPTGEPGLAAIYGELAGIAGWSPAQSALALGRELAFEQAAIVPVPALVAWVEAARAAGLPVAFVSDMYLPAAFIATVLRDLGVARPGEPVLVSCETGESKFAGTLFRRVAEGFQLPPAAILHVGDHAVSDHRIPRALGFSVCHITPVATGSLAAALQCDGDDTEILPHRILAAARLAPTTLGEEIAMPALAEIGAGLLGPLLTGYALWLFAQARARGIRRLYFVARDGQVMREIAQQVQDRLAPVEALELRYLYGSRIAWHHASLRSFSPRQLRWILDPQPTLDTATVADRLGLTVADLRAALGENLDNALLDRSPWTPEDAARVGRALVATETLLLAQPGIAGRRETALRYLRQEGLLDAAPWAVVELGWSGRMMTSLFEALGGDRPFTAFYLALNRLAPDLPPAIDLQAFLRQPGAAGTPDFQGIRLAELLEALTAADHATTLGYEERDDAVGPRLKPDSLPIWPEPALASLRAGAAAYVRALPNEALQALAAQVGNPHGARRHAFQLCQALASFAAHPSAELARPFTQCRFSEDPTDRHPRAFVTPLTVRTALFPPADPSADLWPQGSRALSSPFTCDIASVGLAWALLRGGRRLAGRVRRGLR